MKNFSLIFLMCFSVFLEGGDAVNAAAAQAYANSAQANISTAQNNLQALSEQLNGVSVAPGIWTKGLLSIIENEVCGANFNLDDQGNITTGGLQIDGNGNYTNCNGGLTASYNNWASTVTCWQNYIQGLSNKSDWGDAYDACAAAGVTSASGCPDACTPITDSGNPYTTGEDNFYRQIGCINEAAQTNVLNVISELVSPDSSSGISLNNVNIAITQMNSALTSLLNYMNTGDQTSTVSQISTIANNILTNLNPPVLSAYNAYIDCYNLNCVNCCEAGMTSCAGKNGTETCWTHWVSATQYTPAPCAAALQAWLNALSQLTPAQEQLFNLLLNLYPYNSNSVSYDQRVIPNNLISCLLPNLCTYSNGAYNCNYSVPVVNGDLNAYLGLLTTSIQTVHSTCVTYKPVIASANTRVNAIMTQLKSLGNSISKVADPTNGQIQAVLDQCKTDIDKYQTQLKKREAVTMAISQILGFVLGFATIEVSGGLGIAMLPQLLMVLMMVPQVNNATIGAISTDIGQKIAKAAINVNSNH